MLDPLRVSRLICIPLAALLYSCGGPDGVEPTGGTPAGRGTLYRGMLSLGHEVRSFTPCGESQEAWVLDETPEREVWAVHQELTNRPYEPIYVEARGQMGPPPGEGFGAEYGSQLTVYELRRASLEGKRCEEDPRGFQFQARGNEPFWNVMVAESGIVFSQMGSEPRRFPYRSPTMTAKATAYSSVAEGTDSPIEVNLENARCVDTMSGERFSFVATVRFNDQELNGCGYQGEQ